MKWNILLILGLTGPSSALIRFQCAQLVTQRLDPLVQPGQVPSTHVHQIVGGVRLNFPNVRISIPNHVNRIPSAPPWIPRKICPAIPHAPHASSAKISRTIGQPFCILKREMELINGFLRGQMLDSRVRITG